MYEALISCVSCDEQLEVVAASLEELEQLACECGAGSTIESIAEFEPWRSPPRLRAVESSPPRDEDLPKAA
ncbi:hypothetical protein HJD18_13285 [Thermoleophilia bacterium SCSIO 60948]|nr:hypothetical protein HJD18_13285 [Thermoleophilia bacterium SCSIO 60948]